MSPNFEHQAMVFAIKAHGQQMYGDMPYVWHLAHVVSVAKAFEVTPLVIACCWLHDVLEDTSVTREQIADLFGEYVGEIVFNVSGFGENRNERNADAWGKIKGDYFSKLVKMFDRIANIQACLDDMARLKGNSIVLNRAKMYYNESDEFLAGIGVEVDDVSLSGRVADHLNLITTTLGYVLMMNALVSNTK